MFQPAEDGKDRFSALYAVQQRDRRRVIQITNRGAEPAHGIGSVTDDFDGPVNDGGLRLNFGSD